MRPRARNDPPIAIFDLLPSTPSFNKERIVINGTVKRLVTDRGFGFVIADDSKAEYFFHRSDVGLGTGPEFDRLMEGDRVRFNVVEGSPKGPRACGVEPG
jgi:cold shock CspA family protein